MGVIVLKPFGLRLTLPNKVCFGQNRKSSVMGSLQEFLGISHVIPTLENFQNYFYYIFIIILLSKLDENDLGPLNIVLPLSRLKNGTNGPR